AARDHAAERVPQRRRAGRERAPPLAEVHAEDVASLEREEVVDGIEERTVEPIDRDSARERGRDRCAARAPDVRGVALPVARAHAVLERGERAYLIERARQPAAGQRERARWARPCRAGARGRLRPRRERPRHRRSSSCAARASALRIPATYTQASSTTE